MNKILLKVRDALAEALDHDVINTAKAVAYSGMLMLFPALLVLTTMLAQVPAGTTLAGELRTTLDQLVPADTMELFRSYLIGRPIHSRQVILSAITLSAFAGLGMTLSLMEGFQRAYHLPREEWGFWSRRLRALLLVPIALVPLSLATFLVVFGHQIEIWMVNNAGHEMQLLVILFWRIVRWSLALITGAAFLTTLYHFGTKRTEHWLRVLPGAFAATFLWFPSTLAFGWYVTRVADYSMFYGSFGAGIATLVWLYITAFSVLIGAELNGAIFRDRQSRVLSFGKSIFGSSDS
jgi:membrane protein